MKSTLRLWLLMPIATLALFCVLDRAEAQRGITGGRPGGITGRPGGGATGITGGITGMKGPGTNLGGSTNIGGNNTLGGRPPGSFGGGAGIGGGIGGGPMLETVWTCAKCGQEIGRGHTRPTTTCSKCGLQYVNGTARDKNGFIGGNGGGVQPPVGNTQIGGMGGINQPPQPVVGNNPGGFVGQPPVNPPTTNNVPTTVNNAAKTATGGMIAGGIMSIVFGLAILGSVVFLVINNGKEYSGPGRRRSRD